LVPHRKAAKKSDPKSGPRFGRFFYPCCESDVVDECKDVRGAKVEEGKECLVDGGVREGRKKIEIVLKRDRFF
jgi:hypothetical protein